MNRFTLLVTALLIANSLTGCALKFEPVWHQAADNKPTTTSKGLSVQARLLFSQADDANSLNSSIAAFESVLEENPGDYETLSLLSTQFILLGAAYTQGKSNKSQLFQKAMKYSELAMHTNLEFRNLVANGTAIWDAADALGKKESSAMLFWVTALQYQFKEGMSLPGKIANVGLLQKGLVFLNRIEKVDPDFGGGAVEFGKVICYYALPKTKGGSKNKGDAYMKKAVAKYSNWLLPRWARGKYYYVIKGEAENSRQDLEWVAKQDLSQYQDPYPWRVYFQENSRELLRQAH